MSGVKARRAKSKSVPTKPPRRASQRERERGIDLELGYPGNLRPMMIEQSLTTEGCYITVYHGSRAEFLAAGVPSHLVSSVGSVDFKIRRSNPEYAVLHATMIIIGADRWELEIEWAKEIPGDYGHPAICELARMISIDLGFYCRHHENYPYAPDLESPIRGLLADERAVDFRPRKGTPNLQISGEFFFKLQNIFSWTRMQVLRYGEVFPVQAVAKKTDPKESPMRLVVNNMKGDSAHG